MAAGITETDSMFSTGKVPWHQSIGIGIKERSDTLLKWEAAIDLAGLGWEVEKVPVLAEGKQVGNYVATVRSDNRDPLGIVRDTYRVVQNSEAFSFMNALVDSGELEYETAGSLLGGRVIWALAHVPADLDLGDAGKIEPYLLFRNVHDGSGAMTVGRTPIRVECMNTLDMAQRGMTRKWKVRHIGDPLQRLAEAREQLSLTFAYMEKFEEVAKRLLKHKMSLTAIQGFTAELIPNPKGADAEVGKQLATRREAIVALAQNSPDLANVKGTAWAAYNAVAQYVDHGVTYRDTKRASAAENRAVAIIEGRAQDLKDRALDLLLN